MGIINAGRALFVGSFKFSKGFLVAGKGVVVMALQSGRDCVLPLYLYSFIGDAKEFLVVAYKHGYSKKAALRFFYVLLNCSTWFGLCNADNFAFDPLSTPVEIYAPSLLGATVKIYTFSKRRQKKLENVARGIGSKLELSPMGNTGKVRFHQYQPEKIFNPQNFNSPILRKMNESENDFDERIRLLQSLEREKKWKEFFLFANEFTKEELPFALVTEEHNQRPIGLLRERATIVTESNKVGENKKL